MEIRTTISSMYQCSDPSLEQLYICVGRVYDLDLIFSTRVPRVHILLIYTRVPRSTKELVAGVRARYEKVHTTTNLSLFVDRATLFQP